MKVSGATIRSLADDRQWRGGWYQDIRFPDGQRTFSTTRDFDRSESRGARKWELIEPFLSRGRFLDIGCNAGLHLVKASERYRDLYGIESSEYFMKQCKFVLLRFGIGASLFCCQALDFNFTVLPAIDTTAMLNSLYWVAYSDHDGYVRNAEYRLRQFMGNLAKVTRDLILVGAEDVGRIGGRLDLTKEFVAEHFNIIESGKAKLADRTLNYIYAKSENKPDPRQTPGA